MKTRSTRLLSMLLAVLMIFSLLPFGAFAEETEKTVYVLAGGDFQEGDWDANGDGTVTQHEASAQNVSNILAQISKKYAAMDGFLFMGDYDGNSHGENPQDTIDGMSALMSTVQATYANLDNDNSVLIQGNHDPAGTGFDTTGGQDFDGYSVFVIDEDSYPDRGGSSSSIQSLANQLNTWLQARKDANVPVFVISHLPLAYGTRTYQNGDGKYAKYIFDVLNQAGADGMNIIFMHGHDHAYGCDNPLGGEAIYLPKGDKINIAKAGSQTSYTEETLNFTYMNAGYVGYYNESGYTIDERDDHKLTMTVFAITGNEVKVERYNAYGLYNLKSEGRDGYYSSTNSSASKIGLSINKDVYESPQYINRVEQPEEPTTTTIVEPTTGIKVTTVGTAVTATQVTNIAALSDTAVYANYVAYDINVDGYTQGTSATVSIPLPAYFAAERTKAFYVAADGKLTEMDAKIADGMVTFTTDHFSVYALAQLAENTQPVPTPESTTASSVLVENHSKVVYQYTTSLTAGGKYLIADKNTVGGTANMLSHSGTSRANATATIKAADKYSTVQYIENPNANAVWTASSGIKLSNNGYYLNHTGSIWTGFNVVFITSSSDAESYRYSNSRLTFSTGSLLSPTRYLYHNTDGWGYDPDASNVYLFKETTVNWTEDVAGDYSVTANGYSQVVSPDIASSLNATPNYGIATYFTPNGGTKTATTISGARVTYTIAPNGNPNGTISMLDRTNGAITFSGKTGDALVRITYNWTDADGVAQEMHTDVKVTANPADYEITALKGGSDADFDYPLVAAGSTIQLSNSLKVGGNALTSPVGDIVWESSDPALASVNNNGKVTFKQEITADTAVTFTVKYVIDGQTMASDTITANLKWLDPTMDEKTETFEDETTTTHKETIYVLTTNPVSGEKYIIASRNSAGNGNAITSPSSGSTIGNTNVTVQSGSYKGTAVSAPFIENSNNYIVWTAGGSTDNWTFANVGRNGRYLTHSNNSGTVSASTTASAWMWSNNALYYHYRYSSSRNYTYTLRYNSGWGTNSAYAGSYPAPNGNVYLYKETQVDVSETTTTNITYSLAGTDISVIAQNGYNKQIQSVISAKDNIGGGTTTNPALGGSYSYVVTSDQDGIISAIDENGNITFSGNSGSAHVKVTYQWTDSQGNPRTIIDTIVVTATEPAQSIDITKGGESVTGVLAQKPATEGGSIAGTTMDLNSVYTKQTNSGNAKTNNPEGAVWTSSDTSIASVDENGVLTFTGKEGVFNVTVSYEVDGKTLTDTVRVSASNSLYVVPTDGTDDFPAWPEPGSVRFDKTAQAVGNFSQTGTAMVELSLTGMPIVKDPGVDVIIMLDTSSSMARTSTTLGTYRSHIFAESFKNLLTDLKNSDKDINVAIADFNGFDSYNGTNKPSSPTYPYSRDKNADTTADGTKYDADGTANRGVIYYTDANGNLSTPYGTDGNTNNLNANAFVNAKNINIDAIFKQLDQDEQHKTSGVRYPYQSGTNYDYAFWATYQLGQSIKAKNAANGEDRELIVIFMTDGAPMQYNGYHSNGSSNQWGYWLDGTTDGSSTSSNPTDYTSKVTAGHRYYFGGIGQYAQLHRWNEAVKGSTDIQYEVIDKHQNTSSTAADRYMTNVSGLGATVYSIGFGLDPDQQTETEHAVRVVKQMATSDDYWYIVNSAAELDKAFDNIGEAVMKPGASDIKVTDKISDEYDVVFGYDQFNGNPNKFPANHEFYMQYVSYDLDDQHERTGTYKVIEKVTVNTDANGTILSGTSYAGTSTTGTPIEIMDGGVGFIAKNFTYNKDTRIAEWYLPNTNEKQEYALQYFAYLKDSAFSDVDNQVPADTYPTNDYAYLTYTNTNGNVCKQEYPIPQMTWNGAQVNYVFYLVNENGEPVNQAGQKVDFANAVYVTDTFSYAVKWNDESAEGKLEADYLAKDKVPAGYTLYDNQAEYTITVYEDESNHDLGNNFTINGSQDIGNKNTTKVFNTKAGTKYDTYGTYKSSQHPTFDFANTTVAFAVKWEAKLVPDTVVIDYGIPTLINVTANDMLSTSVVGIGNSLSSDIEVNTGISEEKLFGDEIKFKDGSTASIENGNTIRFTPGSMKITAPINFYYEATASYSVNNTTKQGYMYSTVTVVPATTVYYEDTHSCIVYNGDWDLVGQDTGYNQDPDRPDIAKLAKSIDADNVYGYDGSYTGYNTYSYGAAHKVTVDSNYYASHTNSWPTATFSFTGTGFDLISVTNGATGTVVVAVYDSNGNQVENLIDDTYYGYTCAKDAENPYLKQIWKYGSDNMWHMTEAIPVAENVLAEGETDVRPNRPAVGETVIQFISNYTWTPAGSADNTIYQVPVIRCTDLEYGTYTVIVRPQYAPFFDHNNSGKYDFYLDAIRIYDPAKNNADANAVYAQDKEAAPQYIEIRENLLDANVFDNNQKDVEGIMFIDGVGIIGDEYISDYQAYGPNHEVYLQSGQAIAFVLNDENAENLASAQVGMKLAAGNSGTVKIAVLDGKSMDIKLATATDMYYDFTGIISGDITGNVIVIMNTGDNMVSLTNIKLTHSVPAPKPAPMMTASAAKSAARFVSTMMLQNIPEAPEVFEPAVTVAAPETVKQDDTIAVTVTTSNEVAYITVNGEAVNSCTVNDDDTLTWTYEVKAENVGDMSFAVVAYSESGMSVEADEQVVTVQANEPADDGNIFKTIWNWVTNLFKH